MKRLILSAIAVGALMSTGASAQTGVTTIVGHPGPIQIGPEDRTKIRTYVSEHLIRPVVTRERIVVGSAVPRDVELEAAPADWGPKLNRYRYFRYFRSGEHVMLVDPESRTVVQEVD